MRGGIPAVIVFILVAFVVLGFAVPALIESEVSLQKAKTELVQAEQERDLTAQNLAGALQTTEQLRQELEQTREKVAETGTELVETHRQLAEIEQERDAALQTIEQLKNELALLQQEPEQNHRQVQSQQKPELGKLYKQLLLGLVLGVGALLLIGGLMVGYKRHVAKRAP